MLKNFCLIALLLCALLVGAAPALAGDAEDIVGRWEHPIVNAVYIRFRADGTFRMVSLLDSIDGKYRVLEDGVVEFDTPGIIYGRNVVEHKYGLSGDTLEFFGAKYKRVK
jgi:hypothetical protein